MAITQLVAMRSLAIILIAWPASFALAQFAIDLDFYWLSLVLGCPLLAVSLWSHAAKYQETIRLERRATLSRPFPLALPPKIRRQFLESATRIVHACGLRAQALRHAAVQPP